jgi:RNA polymerase sigma-70 factor (ECF subfamily)
MDFEALAKARTDFDALVADVRPQLLRYCARMTGSAVDGEDIVQEALAKVYFRLPQLGHVENLRAWLFRVAHNKALDYLRRYDVRFGETLEGELPAQTEDSPLDAAEVAEWGLSHFVRLTALQRSCVILKDVLSYRLEEISEILDISVPSIKGALHRGRASLRRQAAAGDAQPASTPPLSREQGALLGRYVALFNARDFDALRAMLAEDVQLELVGMTEKSGAADVGSYFNNYARLEGMRLESGVVDGRPAILVCEQAEARPVYFLLVRFRGERIRFIRDYRYARYVFDEARWTRATDALQQPLSLRSLA